MIATFVKLGVERINMSPDFLLTINEASKLMNSSNTPSVLTVALTSVICALSVLSVVLFFCFSTPKDLSIMSQTINHEPMISSNFDEQISVNPEENSQYETNANE